MLGCDRYFRQLQRSCNYFSNSFSCKIHCNIKLIKLILIKEFPQLLSIYQIIDNPQNVFHVNNFTLKKGKEKY